MKIYVFLLTALLCALSGYVYGQTNRMIADYEQDTLLFTIWGGSGSMEVVDNPDYSEVNNSANVGVSYWGGETFGIESHQLDAPINFAETPYAMLKVWSAKPILVEFQFQKYTDWTISDVRSHQLTEEETSKWVDLVFDFSDVIKDNLDRVVFFLDRAAQVSVEADECFFDDIRVSSSSAWDPTTVDKVFKRKIISYPNPVRDKLTLALPGEVNIASIMIYDISGKKVYQSNITNKGSVEINFGNYKSGVYIIKAVSEEGYMFTEKIMKK